MPPTAVAKLVTTFPDVGFFQLCGPTEGGPTGIYSTPDEVAVRPDATGHWPITNAEFRLVDPDGNDVPTGMHGEIILPGDTIIKGYWNKPSRTDHTIRDWWLQDGYQADTPANTTQGKEEVPTWSTTDQDAH